MTDNSLENIEKPAEDTIPLSGESLDSTPLPVKKRRLFFRFAKSSDGDANALTDASNKNNKLLPPLTKKAVSPEAFVLLGVLLLLFVPIGLVMGFNNMLSTMFSNAHWLLLEVCFWLMAVAVVIGAFSSLLTEFGVTSLLNKSFSPLMKPIYGMPGASSAAIFSCFLSDNPAALTLASDRRYKRYFKKYQFATLTNLGTCFGMGLLIIVFMLGRTVTAGSLGLAVGVGVAGSLAGSFVSTRLMLMRAKKVFGTEEEAEPRTIFDDKGLREIRDGNKANRAFTSILEGAGDGVKIGMGIIPGVLIIANMVMLLTGGQAMQNVYEILNIYDAAGAVIGTINGEIIDTVAIGFTGGLREGVGLIPWIGETLSPVFRILFGFTNAEAISVPLTALGSAGAAISLIGDNFHAREIAVFTAMCMFWSGYLSTHVAMMDGMGFKKLTGSSILFHTIGGLAAGVVASYLYLGLYTLLF